MNLLWFAVPIIACAAITMMSARTLMYVILAFFAVAAMFNLTEIIKALNTNNVNVFTLHSILGFCAFLVVIGLTVKQGK